MDELIAFPSSYEFPVRARLSDEELLGPVPDPPVFPDPLEDIRARYLKLVGTPKIHRDLVRAHHRIRRLLAEDEGRRESQRSRGYLSSFYGPKFDTPFEQRRLRILNGLMLETAKVGGQVSITDQSARSIKVAVHDATLFLRLDHKKRIEDRSGYYHEIEAPAPQTPLHLHLGASWNSSSDDIHWDDTSEAKIEAMIGPIIAEFFVQAEARYRRSRIWEHENRVERKARRIEEIRLAAEKAERERREKEEQERLKRIKSLLHLAENHRKAETIRALVATVETRRGAEAEFLQWREWALCVAATIDPIDAIDFIE